MNRSTPLRLALLFALLLAAPVSAATPARGLPDWSELPAADREALAQPLVERWNRANPEQRQRMLERAQLWASLSPEQKAQARRGIEQFREAHADRREQLRAVWQRLQDLPPEQREALRATWRQLSPAERRAWLEAGGPGVAPPPTRPD